jgi:hypothetical protein
MTTRWWWQNAFSFRPVYIWHLNIAAANRNAEWIYKSDRNLFNRNNKFFGEQSAIWESPSNIPRPFVSFDIFQLIFVRETRIRSTQHSKRCTHNVYRAVTAANMLVEEEDEKTNWYLNQNIFHLGESGHDRAQQQQQLFFPPTLYLRKWDRNFFPTLFSSNFYFSSVQWRPWRGAWLAMTWLHFSSWNWLKSGETTTRFCSEFCFSFLEKRNKLECYSRYLQKQTNKPSNSLNN